MSNVTRQVARNHRGDLPDTPLFLQIGKRILHIGNVLGPSPHRQRALRQILRTEPIETLLQSETGEVQPKRETVRGVRDANYIDVPEGKVINLIDRLATYQRPDAAASMEASEHRAPRANTIPRPKPSLFDPRVSSARAAKQSLRKANRGAPTTRLKRTMYQTRKVRVPR